MSPTIRSFALAALAAFALGSLPASAGSFGRKKPAASSSSSSDEKEGEQGSVRESSPPRTTPVADGGSAPARTESEPAPRRSSSGGSFGRSASRDDDRDDAPRRHRDHDRSGTRVVVRNSYPSYYETGYSRHVHAYYYEPVYISPWGYYAYGYTPYWGAPTPPPAVSAPTPRTTTASFFLGGHKASGTGSLTGDLSIDGARLGINLRGLALGLPDPYEGGDDLMPMFSGHLAYSVVSSPHARVRLEGGFSTIVAPDLNYTGPDFGVSGQLALAGPLSLSGAAHVTPFPAQIVDLEAGVGAQFGTLGLKVGWRRLGLDDRGVNEDGGAAAFSGPTFSLGTVF